MKRILLLSVAFTVMFFIGVAQAQMEVGSFPRIYGEFRPVVGGWSEYQIIAKQAPVQKMKIAVVGKEGDAYWYETVTDGKGGKVIYKMLVSGNPNDEKAVRRMIFKQANNPAMELPVQPMGRAQKKEVKAARMVDKGVETIKVPAGTFKARHLQYEGKEGVDIWVDEKVPPYGLVKSQSKDAEMILTGFGLGAKSQITETPQKFDMPRMPRR